LNENMVQEQFVEEEISLTEIIQTLKKRMKLILIITLISMAITALITFFILSPQYESSITLMVGKPTAKMSLDPENAITYQEIQTNRMLVSTYGEIAKSRSVLSQVIKELKLDLTTESLRGKIDVSLVKDTELIRIAVTDEDPEKAATIANNLALCFGEKVVDVMNIENMQVIDKAVPVFRPVSPRPKLNMAISLVLGLMIGIFAAFLMEFLDTSIKTPEDVAKFLDLPVIGSIPYIDEKEA